MYIIDGLPLGSDITCTAVFQGITNVIRAPGGPLGGETESFQAMLKLGMTGTGGMAGFSRSIDLPISLAVISAAPRDTAATVQILDLDFSQMQGQLPPGDPDFDLLRITAGTGFGMPSPGHTTLTKRAGR